MNLPLMLVTLEIMICLNELFLLYYGGNYCSS